MCHAISTFHSGAADGPPRRAAVRRREPAAQRPRNRGRARRGRRRRRERRRRRRRRRPLALDGRHVRARRLLSVCLVLLLRFRRPPHPAAAAVTPPPPLRGVPNASDETTRAESRCRAATKRSPQHGRNVYLIFHDAVLSTTPSCCAQMLFGFGLRRDHSIFNTSTTRSAPPLMCGIQTHLGLRRVRPIMSAKERCRSHFFLLAAHNWSLT